jgi:hypothetical protein
MRRVTAGALRQRRSAAALKLPRSAAARNASMVDSDGALCIRRSGKTAVRTVQVKT